MPTPARFYSSVARETTLTASITGSSTTIQVASTAGFPGSTPFTLALDYGQTSEELVDVTNVASLSLTVTRAVDGTSGTSHNAGAVVRHTSSGRDFSDGQTHYVATTNVHGVTGLGNDLVGTLSTQTLTNKTLNRATGSLNRIDIFNTGNWVTDVIGDSANPGFSRFTVMENEINLRQMFTINSVGAAISTKAAAEVDATYRYRLTDSDTTTDRFSVLAGGTVQITPTSTAVAVANDIVAPDTSTAKRAIRVAAAGGGTERFTVWNDGRIDVVGTSTTLATFDITGPASPAANYTRVMDTSGNTLTGTGPTGKFTAGATADIKNDFHTGGVSTPVLRIFARQPGQTGDLTQWVNSSNAIVATVDNVGNAAFATIGATSTTFTNYTPTWGNTGGATFTTNNGYFNKIGKIVFVNIQGIVNAAGSGAGVVSVTLPSSADRSMRQAMVMQAETIGANGDAVGRIRGGEAVLFTGGTGAVVDRLRVDGGAAGVAPQELNILGADMLSGGSISIQGWYREA